MSTVSYQRSNSYNALSKNNSKSSLLDSKTLQGVLGLTPDAGKVLKTKADRKAQRRIMQSKKREYNRMVESILLEETGQITKRCFT